MAKRNDIAPPADARRSGTVAFNYTDHDGRFVVGMHPWLFETKWSSAGSGSIHLYNDPPSILGIAIANGATCIEEITPDVVLASNFSSRSRRVSIGQCALIENTNGIVAAIEPLEIIYADNPWENLIRFRYAIGIDGARDFSSTKAGNRANTFHRDKLIHVARNAEAALADLEVATAPSGAAQIGIGHNRPPSDFAMSAEDKSEALAAIRVIKSEAEQPKPSLRKLADAGTMLARKVKLIASWMAAKAELAADEFAKTIGKAAAVATVGAVAAWAAVHWKLTMLLQHLAQFVG